MREYINNLIVFTVVSRTLILNYIFMKKIIT